jgi:hypothetical protein
MVGHPQKMQQDILKFIFAGSEIRARCTCNGYKLGNVAMVEFTLLLSRALSQILFMLALPMESVNLPSD